MNSILKAKSAMISIGARVAVVVLALALTSSDAFALPKPDLVVLVFGAGADTRPITAPGQPFSFRVGLDNKNAVDAHRVKLIALLPKGLKFQSSDPPPTRIDSGYNPVWEIDTLDPKALPRFFEVKAEAETNLAPDTQLKISAEAESSEGNANSADNHASYAIYVQPVGPKVVFFGSTLDSTPLTTDGPATFKVDLRNAGNLPATDARLLATLPKEMRLDKSDPQPESSSGQVVTFKLGDLARAESRSITMTVEFDPGQLPDVMQSDRPLTFAFEASGAGPAGKVTNTHFAITKHIESAGQDVAVWLAIEGAKEPGELLPGSDVTSVIKCANLGNQLAHKVVVTLNLGAGMAIRHSDPQPSGTATNDSYPGGIAHWDISDLGVGVSRTIQAVIHVTSVPEDGALLNATITADGIDIDPSNNSASLLWHSPLPPGTLKSMRRASAIAKTVGGSEGAPVRPASHRLRHLFELILAIVAVLIFIRARRTS